MTSNSYLIELTRWNIKNDGTDAASTSSGINAALSWAEQEGYNEVVLPRGVYLIDENNPIKPYSFMTFNLSGATLRIRNNNLPKYAIILLANNQKYTQITNGKIEGDRYNHNYSGGGTHEFGVGIELRNGVENIKINNLEIYNTTGDGILGITSFGGIGGNFPKLADNMEPGGINTSTGALTQETNRIRSKVNIPMVPQITNLGYFGLYGDSFGGIGKEITTDIYDVIFYKNDNSFLSSVTELHFFDEVEVPLGASYAKVVLHQKNVPSSTGNTILIRTPEFPKYVFIENCNIHHCRRLGVAICGMKYCYINSCEIHHISGIAPQGAIDIEDGYDLNQYIFINGNNIYDNKSYNIIAVAGKHLSITNNRIQLGIFTINSGVNKAIVENNYFYNCGPRLEGETVFSNNYIYGSKLLLLGNSQQIISNCQFQNSPIVFNKLKAYVVLINNSKFTFDEDFKFASLNPGSPLIFSIEPQTITDSTFEGCGIEAFAAVPNGAHDWILSNVIFYNTRHPENRIFKLPPGIYKGCKFINSGRLGESSGAINTKYEFDGCHFEWSTYPLFYFAPSSKIHFFSVNNCHFDNLNSYDASFFINGNWGNIHLSNNTFNYPNGNRMYMIDVRNTAVVDNFVVTNNTFLSNGMISLSVSASTIPVIFRDNFLTKSPTRLLSNHIQLNNIVDNILIP
ncbi:right-handed parallel beta-helix repeat-containing protein [Bacillus sp. Y1]|nr:right-handed parallel beta-helix repeat-containing protein [Bacillus sp. Y1]AYA77599.1 right-handed parallel beta-helix repeat-containing protein [Bacillus sp. Y1]